MKTFYEKLLKMIKNHHLEAIVTLFEKYSPYFIALLYLSTLLYLLFFNNTLLLKTIIKPLFSFIFVTIIRKFINRPRPCITLKITPLIGHKQYQSFPSRHTTSAFSIAFALSSVNALLGFVSLITAFIVAITRILCGVHFISDVIAGFIISLIIHLI